MNDALKPLLTRRSTSVKDLEAPAPTRNELDLLLRVATRVPDHGKLCPWRIVVLEGEGASQLGELAAREFSAHHPEATEPQVAAERTRFQRAPLCLAVLSTPVITAKPVWEQELSAGAVCVNILHAAHALGYGAKWLTEWVAYNPAIIASLLESSVPMSGPYDAAPVKIAGFIYLGTKTAETEDRARPALQDIVSRY